MLRLIRRRLRGSVVCEFSSYLPINLTHRGAAEPLGAAESSRGAANF